jgi:hypothetical protein
MPIAARTLWYHEPESCTCPADWDPEDLALLCQHNTEGGWYTPLWRGPIGPSGRVVVTDRIIALYTSELTGAEQMPAPALLAPHQIPHLAKPLLSPIDDRPVTRLFRGEYLDLLETAGYRIRALTVGGHPHGVVADGKVVGLLMPMALNSASTAAGDRVPLP